MSRIGNKPIIVPDNVQISISSNTISAKGPLGEDHVEFLDCVDVTKEGNEILVKPKSTDKNTVACQGLFRALINNLILGATQGFEKDLEIIGVGYRATQQGKDILFQLGYSHNITFEAPEGITLQVVEPTKIKIKGVNKHLVGQTAANIRELRSPEPYKGKGIRYKNENVRKKAGKTGK